MAVTANATIQEVNGLYTPTLAGKIGNCPDLDIGAKIKNINQSSLGCPRVRREMELRIITSYSARAG